VSFGSSPSAPSSSNGNSAGSYQVSYSTGFGSSPANVEIIDESQLPTIRFKRQSAATVAKTESKKKRTKAATTSTTDDKKKRELGDFTDGFDEKDFFDKDWYDGLAQFGDNEFKSQLTKHDSLEDEIKEHDREPAEGEVEAVRLYCNSCLVEPFESALVIGWKSASGNSKVLKAKASKVCGDF
jgi:hypothetical protein